MLQLLGCHMWKPNLGALSWGPAREDLQALAGAQPLQIMTLNCAQFSVFQHSLTCRSITSTSRRRWWLWQPEAVQKARLFALCPEAGGAISQTGLKAWEHQSHSAGTIVTSERAAVCQGCSLLDPETLVPAFKAWHGELLGDRTWSCKHGFASPAPGSRDC